MLMNIVVGFHKYELFLIKEEAFKSFSTLKMLSVDPLKREAHITLSPFDVNNLF